MSEEVWKPVRDGYEVSNLGRIRTIWVPNKKRAIRGPWWVLNLKPSRSGYVQVSLRAGVGRREVTLVHMLVLEAFVGPRPTSEGSLIEARHLNDCKHDNRLENLAWGTQHENIADALRNKRFRSDGKLDPEDVLEIRRRRKEQGASYSELALAFGVSKPYIGEIIRRESWFRIGEAGQ